MAYDNDSLRLRQIADIAANHGKISVARRERFGGGQCRAGVDNR